jgi:hypothetical protein
MSKHSRVGTKGLLLSIFAVILFSFSNRHPVVAQNSDSKRFNAIKVVISDAGGVTDEDTIAYKGDTIDFCPEKPNRKFSVIFTKSPFEPLGQGKLRFDERDCGHPEKVDHKAQDHARAYDYVLAVGAKYFDPHVIVMGN